MKCLVTGAAGFIGSTLSERLIVDGYEVVGIDAFTDYYERSDKEANLQTLCQHSKFRLVEADLSEANLNPHLEGVDYVFHLAGQPGVRASWGNSFDTYTRHNILATQRLLEAAKGKPLKKLVYASSSSIYGDAEAFPTSETTVPQPVSPYGVTKLGAEHLCYLYWKNYGVPTVSVRYFTVYGPRQRPDMAFHRFLRALLSDRPIEVYGDGEQTRDFTFVTDAVDGTVRAATNPVHGEVFNLGGGSRVALNQVLVTLATVVGRTVRIDRHGNQKGDVRHTSADTRKAHDILGYAPQVGLADGLKEEYLWLQQRSRSLKMA